ncbi:DUF4339 domain-containing protein [Anatilimnocola sp. NA78]|uniref:DUF4339 domain-containing protein n=1 Tax=Anatilimnocola sp. NA78 TaxID=3415683 RepID=UPI003CE4928F
MGIRFHCPNGHKLNVKSFLAGKKGVCPDCGSKFRIPPHSEPGLGGDEPDEQPVAATLAEQPVHNAPQPAAPVHSAPAVAPVAAMPVAGYAPAPVAAAVPTASYARPAVPVGAVPSGVPLPQMHAGPQPVASSAPPYAMPAHSLPPPPPMNNGQRDPIAENPLATWFVRPPSGGQFGPARGEVMRKWLTEGRVTADSLVWREGWTDWLSATDVFPAIGKAATPAYGSPAAAPRPSSAALPGRKKSSGAMGTAILVLLAIICVILVAVLAFVLSGGAAAT